jgi:salicylate hydroxylase
VLTPGPDGAGVIFFAESAMLAGQEISVLGAGIGGLAVARALALRGAKVRVYEQATEIAEVGAGLQISPNGFAVLRGLGLDAGLAAKAQPGEAVELVDGTTGDLVARINLLSQAPRGEFLFAHRADLIEVLANGARDAGVDIVLGHRIEEVGLGDGPPRLVTANGQSEDVPLLIGADGLHSRVRTGLNGAAAPFFTQQVAWRATVPGDAAMPPVARVYMGAGKHLVTYPLRGGALRNIVAVEERRTWVEESWSLTDDPLALRIAFADFVPEVRGWLDQIERPNLWGLFRHSVAPVWHGHGAVILGDAAHPTLPFLAQGANMALEDAWVLADCLAATTSGDAAFSAYQAHRKTRCLRIVEAANANARNYHLSGVRRDVGHAVLRVTSRFAPNVLANRFRWLYGHDVTQKRQVAEPARA